MGARKHWVDEDGKRCGESGRGGKTGNIILFSSTQKRITEFMFAVGIVTSIPSRFCSIDHDFSVI